MKFRNYSIPLLGLALVLSLMAQNTCPFGQAGKTAFAAKHLCNCPMRNDQQPQEGTDGAAWPQASIPPGSAFVMNMPGTVADLLPRLPTISFEPEDLTAHTSIFGSPPFKPPKV